MPSTCCVPGCKANYPSSSEDKVKVFQFPKDDKLRSEWLRKIPRQKWSPGPRSVVCLKHFKESDVIKVDKITQLDGSVLEFPRERFKLSPNAVPCIFENLPSYLSESPTVTRKAPNLRHESVLQRENEKIQQFLDSDLIPSFEDLIISESPLKPHWNRFIEDSCVTYYKLQPQSVPLSIFCSFSISKQLIIFIYVEKNKVPDRDMAWLLNKNKENLVIKRYSQIENLISHLDNIEKSCDNVLSLEQILFEFKLYIDSSKSLDSGNFDSMRFFYEQMTLVSTNQYARRYSPRMLAWAFSLHIKSAVCYRELFDSGLIALPHERYLRKLSSVLSFSGSQEGSEHYYFLKSKCEKLEQHEKVVNLLVDEIIIRPQIHYGSNTLTGMSINKNMEKATGVQTFMISSLNSSNKDVVALLPVKNMTASELVEMTRKIINMVQQCGFKIISVISDNNRVNRNMFTALCGGVLKTCTINPNYENEKIFFLFDSVHILKCLRNNWLSKQTEGNTLIFPDFDDPQKHLFASFDHLRSLYVKERDSLIKFAPKLTSKAISPSNLERQNVSLCLKIFDETNINALKMLEDNELSGTIQFLNIVVKWWKILNVKNLNKGRERLDSDSMPFYSATDERILFLEKCVNWLEAWKLLETPGKHRTSGKLTAETFCSFLHTTKAIKELIVYQLNILQNTYVLTGKYQTDHLEGRFGQYRQLNGGNYNISFEQILRSEKKLRLKSVIELYSSRFGKFSLSDFLCNFEVDDSDDNDHLDLDLEIEGIDFFNYTEEEETLIPVFVYLSGYAVFKVKGCLQCQFCKIIISTEKTIIFEMSEETEKYLQLVDRGKLTYPNEDIVKVFIVCYKIFKALLSDSCENLLHVKNVKRVLKHVVTEKLIELEIMTGVCSNCNRKRLDLGLKCVNIFLNIFLNNYSKLKNDCLFQNRAGKKKYSVFASNSG